MLSRGGRVLTAVLIVTSCSVSCFSRSARAESPPAVESNLGFSLKLFSKLRLEKGNLAFSPFSIEEALGMCHFGGKGETAKELATALEFPATTGDLRLQVLSRSLAQAAQKKEFVFHLANALFLEKEYPFESAYVEGVKQRYLAEIHQMDFIHQSKKAKEEINSWVEDQTEEKIKNLLSDENVNERTRAVLVNAIYFKADWQTPFEKEATQDAEFTQNNGSSVKVPFLHAQEGFAYTENSEFQLLELPYKGGQVSMMILLPLKKDGLAEVESKLTEKTLSGAISALKTTQVSVALPKFRAESKMSLPEVLKELGVQAAFLPNVADFSGFDGTKRLVLSEVIHQASVEVDEKGTEAAAATAVVMADLAAMIMEKPKEFIASHPFLFFIRERSTGSMVFLGRIEKL